ncbi:Ubiquitin carboxyl-terminal hydrolase 22 [Quaeritorhiza haematococci]|nr:Ubiquitin carboxyl-terminal hydrolase 22 [Quaeritorhiza haematococci]
MTESNDKLYKVVVAVNNSPASFKALDQAVSLCQNLACPYKLFIIYVVALNPPQTLPYIDHLEKAYNVEIQSNAVAEVEACKDYLTKKYAGKVTYDFNEVEGEGETGPLIEEYILENHPDLDLLIVGTRNLGTLKRWVLGSVSDHLVHNMNCPVMVVKDPSSAGS